MDNKSDDQGRWTSCLDVPHGLEVVPVRLMLPDIILTAVRIHRRVESVACYNMKEIIPALRTGTLREQEFLDQYVLRTPAELPMKDPRRVTESRKLLRRSRALEQLICGCHPCGIPIRHRVQVLVKINANVSKAITLIEPHTLR